MLTDHTEDGGTHSAGRGRLDAGTLPPRPRATLGTTRVVRGTREYGTMIYTILDYSE